MGESIYRASRIYEELFGGVRQSFKCVVTEVMEVFEALGIADFMEAAKEFRQVLFELQMHIYHYSRVDFELVFCSDVVDGFYGRRQVWIKMFEDRGLVFNPVYLRNGSNYLREYKIKLAFQLAGLDISLEEAKDLQNKYHEA